MKMMNGSAEVIEQLKNRNKEKVAELAAVIQQYDTRRFHDGPYLEARYLRTIGKLEQKVFGLYVISEGIKKEIELSKQYVGKGEKPDKTEIAKALALSLKGYRDKLVEMAAKQEEAATYLAAPWLSEEQDRDLQRLYRQAVKAVQPAVRFSDTEAIRSLWKQVVQAYQRGDLERLRELTVLADQESLTAAQPEAGDAAALERRIAKIDGRIEAYKEKLAALANAYPFTMEELLHSEALQDRKTGELYHLIEQYEAYIRELTATLALLQAPMGPVS